jgi:hypothetical protein
VLFLKLLHAPPAFGLVHHPHDGPQRVGHVGLQVLAVSISHSLVPRDRPVWEAARGKIAERLFKELASRNLRRLVQIPVGKRPLLLAGGVNLEAVACVAQLPGDALR